MMRVDEVTETEVEVVARAMAGAVRALEACAIGRPLDSELIVNSATKARAMSAEIIFRWVVDDMVSLLHGLRSKKDVPLTPQPA